MTAGPRRKRKALGRGLDALLPDSGRRGSAPASVPLDRIEPSPDQPRKSFDPEKLEALARSLARRGLIQPIVVRPVRDGRYQIVAGERRFRAARMAGLAEVPVVVRSAAELEAYEVRLVENLQREDLNPIEAAEAYHRLIDEHGQSQEQVATAVGRSRPAVANTLRLLTLPEAVTKMLLDGTLSEGHARAVLLAEGAARQVQVAREVARRGLSVREAERLARLQAGPRRAGPARSTSAEVRDLEDQLKRALGARVQLRHGRGGKGSITIRYSSLDELDSLLDRMLGRKRR
jgi:ParB family chromosome partitioning protein